MLVATDTAEFCFSELAVLGSAGGLLFATPSGLLDPVPDVSRAVLTVTREGVESEIAVDITTEMVSCSDDDATRCFIELGTITVTAGQ